MKRLLIIVTLMLVAASCSVPTEDSAQIINQDDLPETLRNATSTTTTTTLASSTETFVYYLLQQRAEQDSRFTVAVSRPVEAGLSLPEQLRPLFGDDFPGPDEETTGLVNPISQLDLVDVVVNDSGVATVRMEIDTPLTELQRLGDVAAQLVWTLTELDGIDAILIEVNGALAVIPTPDGDVSESVNKDNFKRYERDFEFPEAPDEPADAEGAGDG